MPGRHSCDLHTGAFCARMMICCSRQGFCVPGQCRPLCSSFPHQHRENLDTMKGALSPVTAARLNFNLQGANLNVPQEEMLLNMSCQPPSSES